MDRSVDGAGIVQTVFPFYLGQVIAGGSYRVAGHPHTA
jgi:hypothetical protein